MEKKTTLQGRFLQAGALMLLLSLVIGLVLGFVMLMLFTAKDPSGKEFLLSLVSLFKDPGGCCPM